MGGRSSSSSHATSMIGVDGMGEGAGVAEREDALDRDLRRREDFGGNSVDRTEVRPSDKEEVEVEEVVLVGVFMPM